MAEDYRVVEDILQKDFNLLHGATDEKCENCSGPDPDTTYEVLDIMRILYVDKIAKMISRKEGRPYRPKIVIQKTGKEAKRGDSGCVIAFHDARREYEKLDYCMRGDTLIAYENMITKKFEVPEGEDSNTLRTLKISNNKKRVEGILSIKKNQSILTTCKENCDTDKINIMNDNHIYSFIPFPFEGGEYNSFNNAKIEEGANPFLFFKALYDMYVCDYKKHDVFFLAGMDREHYLIAKYWRYFRLFGDGRRGYTNFIKCFCLDVEPLNARNFSWGNIEKLRKKAKSYVRHVLDFISDEVASKMDYEGPENIGKEFIDEKWVLSTLHEFRKKDRNKNRFNDFCEYVLYTNDFLFIDDLIYESECQLAFEESNRFTMTNYEDTLVKAFYLDYIKHFYIEEVYFLGEVRNERVRKRLYSRSKDEIYDNKLRKILSSFKKSGADTSNDDGVEVISKMFDDEDASDQNDEQADDFYDGDDEDDFGDDE